ALPHPDRQARRGAGGSGRGEVIWFERETDAKARLSTKAGPFCCAGIEVASKSNKDIVAAALAQPIGFRRIRNEIAAAISRLSAFLTPWCDDERRAASARIPEPIGKFHR